MVNPFRHRELNAADVLNLDWGTAYKIERIIKEDLERYER